MQHPSFADRQRAAADAKKQQLEHHRAKLADPEYAKRQKVRRAVVLAREARIAERRAVEEARRVREAAEKAAQEAAERAAQEAARQAELAAATSGCRGKGGQRPRA